MENKKEQEQGLVNNMENEKEQELGMNQIANLFAQASGSADEEILRITSQYALQLTPGQIYTIMKLKAFALDYGAKNSQLKNILTSFIADWLEIKHYHESGGFILRVVDSLSLKRIIPNDATKVNVMK